MIKKLFNDKYPRKNCEGIYLAYITCLEEEFLEHNSNGGGNP